MPPKKQAFVDPTSENITVEESGTASKGGPFMQLDNARFMNVNYSAEFMATLPAGIRRRVNGLLALDQKYEAMRAEVNAKRRALLEKFDKDVAAPIYAQRRAIVLGAEAPSEELIQAGFPAEHKEGGVELGAAAAAGADDGLDGFWLRALQRHVIINDMITERDAAVMRSLIDVSITSIAGDNKTAAAAAASSGEAAAAAAPAERGFQVKFEFGANDFFTNTELTKTFYIKEVFGEPTVARTEGTVIAWKTPERNVTQKIINKKQKAKVKGKVVHRTIKRTVRIDSFFHFFSSNSGRADEDTKEGGEEQVDDASDFAEMDDDQWLGLANVLKDKIIPYAVEYFDHEANDGQSDLDDDDYSDYGEEGEEEEEDDDEDHYAPIQGRGGRGGGGGMGRQASSGGASGPAPGGKRGGGAPAPGGKQQDCKQQ
jgi:nucleosome assembly protein 1-like 1